jgi:hypothetical protein
MKLNEISYMLSLYLERQEAMIYEIQGLGSVINDAFNQVNEGRPYILVPMALVQQVPTQWIPSNSGYNTSAPLQTPPPRVQLNKVNDWLEEI